MLKPNTPETTPHGRWKYHHAFSNHTSGPFYTLGQLFQAVRNHRNANGIITPIGWKHEFLDELCKQQGLDCYDDQTVHEDELVTQIGRALWVELHTYTENYPDDPSAQDQEHARHWLDHWMRRIPNFSHCSCQSDFMRWYSVYPAPLESGVEFRRWSTVMHDRVNKKLGRPLKYPESAKHPVFQV